MSITWGISPGNSILNILLFELEGKVLDRFEFYI